MRSGFTFTLDTNLGQSDEGARKLALFLRHRFWILEVLIRIYGQSTGCFVTIGAVMPVDAARLRMAEE